MNISGKRVLITGANRGLGRALALACARRGAAEVIACARRTETLDALLSEATGLQTRITPVQLDITKQEEVTSAAEQSGRVDILINNAGIAVFGGVLKAELEDLEREVEINYLGVIRMVRAFAPAMADFGDGVIVNIASQLGKVNLPALGTYCATKAALLSLSQAMRGDLAPAGVRVISVLPGTLDTDMSRGFDIPKMPPLAAAEEILEAIRREDREVAIGDEARKLLSDLAADPVAVEEGFSQFRA
ncbi:MAG: SDR family NAD(P)-dependent oxidoreductase [Blastocatellia bacterium]|nr:SDR family NAD(P)-dependent oxidoreductase [Blastocatellia bacterium]